MLPPEVINGLRALAERSLAAGLVKITEVAALSRMLLALEVEEKIWKEAQAKIHLGDTKE